MIHPVRKAALAVVVLALLAACSCSSSGGDDAGNVPSTIGSDDTFPESKGLLCTDPTGDISTDPKAVGTMTEPAGIDIVTAEAKVDGDVLAVTYTMNGPISLVPEPFFNLLQGDMSAPQYTFELRTEPAANGNWGLTLITFDTGTDARKQLTTPVTVTGNTLSYRVPLSQIPKIATLLWTFGVTATMPDGSVPFDDCSSLTGNASTTTEPIVTVPPGN
jgi:hypothetical protein